MGYSTDVEQGQAIYTRPVLSIYDIWVLGLSNRYIWQCPTQQLLDNYNCLVTNNHLDIGVGTGYFLDKCTFPAKNIRIGLMDLNQNSLDKTAKRIRRYNPIIYQCNVLEPVTYTPEPFDSVAVNYLFHCLPGKLSDKLTILDNIGHLMSVNCVLFGSTIIGRGLTKNYIATKLMDIYNRKEIFCNTEDRLEDLESYLSEKYLNYQIHSEGCVAIFSATNSTSFSLET